MRPANGVLDKPAPRLLRTPSTPVLKQRVITAIVLLSLLAAAAAGGTLTLLLAFALLLGAAAFEWLRLAQRTLPTSISIAAVFVITLLFLETLARFPRGVPLQMLLLLSCAAWLILSALVIYGAQRGTRIAHLLSSLLCLVLLTGAWLGLVRLLGAGLLYLLSVLVIVWLADIAAYFAGRRWGRRKLAPAISPGKTWAGAAGAMIAVLLAAVVAAQLRPDMPLFSTLLLTRLSAPLALGVLALLVALSIIGDLFESLLKRQVNAKDSGRLLPGHGGVLDRVDALIAVLPAAALLDLWMRG